MLIGLAGTFDSYGDDVDFSLCCVPFAWCWLGICWLFKPLSYVADHIVASCRFALRYTLKFAAGTNTTRKRMGHRRQKLRLPNSLSKQKNFADSKSPSAGLPFELLVMVAEKVHFADLVSLSQSSRRLRAFFFNDGHPRSVLEQLRQYACDGSDKTQCSLCSIQICGGGKVSMPTYISLSLPLRAISAQTRECN